MPKEVEKNTSEALKTAMEAGKILLENGAEIYRVEETITRMARHFGAPEENLFVLSNGIFMSAEMGGEGRYFSDVRFVPMHSASLDKVVAVNQLSRDLEADKYTLEEVQGRLKEIANMPGYRNLYQMLAAGLGAGSFCMFLGGHVLDGLSSLLTGVIMYFFLLEYIIPKWKVSKIAQTLTCGTGMTVLCLLFYRIGLGHDLNIMIIGGAFPFISGISFTNGIRDLAAGDYISGMVRMLDALLTFVCLAISVGTVLSIYQQFFGGVL